MSLIFLFLAIIIEGSFFSFPFVFLFLLFLSLRYDKSWIFVLAFVSGIILDAITLRNIGSSSLFFLVFLFAVFQYARKFEIGSSAFIVISAFLGSFVYLSLFGDSFVLQKALLTALIAFFVSRFFLKERVALN